jgi:exopolyphosphatase / guanosine-5'-triphosphate,3'-diphosphate pyrophosphatase
MPVAAIDIGTNTVLLLVADRKGDDIVAVAERATITRLGEGVDKTRTLAPAAIERTNAAIDAYAQIIKQHGVTRVDVVGTSAMRDAGGGEAVREHVKKMLGVEARTISGDEEAKLTFAGALSGIRELRAGTVRVFDIGGGSTEVVHGTIGRVGAGPQVKESSAISYAHSFDVGSVRLTERHVTSDPPTKVEIDAVSAAARAVFAAVPKFESSQVPPVGIAGTMTTIAAIALEMETYDGSRVHGMRLSTSELRRVIDRLARVALAERVKIPGLEPKRADVIIAGALIAAAYLDHVGAEEVIVSDRGVRWGLVASLLT